MDDLRRGPIHAAGGLLSSAGTVSEHVPSSTCGKYPSGERWRSVHNNGLLIGTYRDAILVMEWEAEERISSPMGVQNQVHSANLEGALEPACELPRPRLLAQRKCGQVRFKRTKENDRQPNDSGSGSPQQLQEANGESCHPHTDPFMQPR